MNCLAGELHARLRGGDDQCEKSDDADDAHAEANDGQDAVKLPVAALRLQVQEQ